MREPRLWYRWVLANGLGEMIGLGATLAVGAAFFTYIGEPRGAPMILLSFLVAVISGVIEASVVGLAQWQAMRPFFPGIGQREWWLVTLIGALLAYVLGYLPSTIMSLNSTGAAAAAPAEPVQWIILLLAAGMGTVGGALLSFAQWRVLRNTVTGAGLWIPANMLAWMAGMPVIFWGIDAAQKGQPMLISALILALALLAAGLIVGAIHGAFLVRFKPVRSG